MISDPFVGTNQGAKEWPMLAKSLVLKHPQRITGQAGRWNMVSNLSVTWPNMLLPDALYALYVSQVCGMVSLLRPCVVSDDCATELPFH